MPLKPDPGVIDGRAEGYKSGMMNMTKPSAESNKQAELGVIVKR